MWRSLFKNMEKDALRYQTFSFLCSLSLPAMVFDFCYGMSYTLGHGDISRAGADPHRCLETLPCDSVVHPLPGPPSHQALKQYSMLRSGWESWSRHLPFSWACHLNQRQAGTPVRLQNPYRDPLSTWTGGGWGAWSRWTLMEHVVALPAWDGMTAAMPAKCTPDGNPPRIISSPRTGWGGNGSASKSRWERGGWSGPKEPGGGQQVDENPSQGESGLMGDNNR